jgi:hypothetical protein
MRQERDQAMLEFTNIFDTLRTKLGIKYSERHLVLKYHGGLHRYIQDEMEFLYISSLGTTYRYAIKIKQKIKQKTKHLGLGTPHRKRKERVPPTHKTKEKENMDSLRKTSPIRKQRRTPKRQIKIPRGGATSIRAPGITLLISAQRSHWWLS